MNFFVHKALAATINVNLPGTAPSSTGIGGFVSNFYSFALLMSGILAFGAIVWGGIRYAAGRGNPTSESEGKSWITGALLGLLLLAGAWIILYTVNPNILSLQLPGLPTLGAVPTSTAVATTSGSGGSGSCGMPYYGPCPSGQTCNQGGNGVYSCVTTGGFSTSTNPVCKGVSSGCTIWVLKSPTPTNCYG